MPKHTALTAKRNLRTGVSYWQSRPMPGVPGTHLTHDIDTDVLVVGAGISGALVAEALAGDYRVVVVDRRGVARGSTPASTALVQYEIDTPLINLAHKIGADDARAPGAGRNWRSTHWVPARANSASAVTRRNAIHSILPEMCWMAMV
jgi:glycine/D-amino acid oxidase-like deaminating enzyme